MTYSDFTALGQPRTVTYANGVITNYQYDSQNNRLYSITTNSPTQGLQNISYAYDNAGNITTLTDHMDATNTQTFTYDHLSRLTQAQSTAYGTLTWEYNQIGNMTNNSQLGAYTYSTTKPHAVVQAGANVYAYDANGNMSSRKGVTITWNYDNKPSQMGTVQFAYDHSGARVKKIGATTTVYVGKLYECTSGVCTKYIFGLAKVASKKGSNTYFYHGDHLGSANVVTDQTGAKVQEVKYYPFGGTRSNVGSVNVKHKYTDQEEDAETGLYYYNARYYDPELSRFVSADSIIPDPSDPQDFNRYSYVSNNPIIYVDPSGHEGISLTFESNGGSYGSGISFGYGNYGSFGSWSSWQNSWGGGYGGYGGGGNNALATFAAQLTMMQFMNNYFASMSVAPAAAPAAVAPAAPSRAAPAPAVQSTRFQSSPLLLATVPGQHLWDNAVNSALNGNYGYAAIYATGMLAEQALFVTTLGSSYLAKQGPNAVTKTVVSDLQVTYAQPQYTKSSLKLGQEMHRAYRKGEVLYPIRRKEFTLPTGKRVDFIDFENKIIYELKPNNPRAIREGREQLSRYLNEVEEIYGKGWKTILDLY